MWIIYDSNFFVSLIYIGHGVGTHGKTYEMKISIRAIIFTLLYLLDKTRTAQLPISINQNGYEGVTIVISNNIEENVVIVEKLKVGWL